MSQKTIQLSFFIVITLGLLILSFFIFKPFLSIIFLSAVLSTVFNPLYKRLLAKTGGKKNISAILTVLSIIIAIIIPATLVFTALFKEAIGLYNTLAFGGGSQAVTEYINAFLYKAGKILPLNTQEISGVDSYVRDILGWIIENFGSVFNTIFQSILGFVLMLLSVYYFLRNGETVKKLIVLWSPLPDSYDEEIIKASVSSVDAVLRGRFLVSIAQGFFLGLGFFMFGVANPVLWGFVGAIASLIPALGTSLVTVPAAVYLLLSGHTGSAIGMVVWGALAVGLVDDTLSFFILKRKIKIHPLVILFSILGGVNFFGPIGFLAGPVVVSTLISLMRVYPFIISQKSNLNNNGTF